MFQKITVKNLVTSKINEKGKCEEDANLEFKNFQRPFIKKMKFKFHLQLTY